MSESSPNIEDAALAALAEERAAAEAEEQARRDGLADRAKERLAEVLAPRVDAHALDVDVWVDRGVVTASDGETTLVVDAQEQVRLGSVVDGQPTGLSEPVRTLADLGRLLEKRGR